MGRIYSIDFFKLLFAYLIALAHFGVNIKPGSWVVVQIFYIISGFFLAKKFYSKSYLNEKNDYNQWNYTIDHIKSLYPHYIFSLMALFLLTVVYKVYGLIKEFNLDTVRHIFEDVYALIPEVFLLQNTGFFGGGINYPLWQLCALLISGYFVYGLLCVNEKLSREIIFPAAILMIQALLYTNVDIWGTVFVFHVPLLRAFSPICIGVLTYYFTTTVYYENIKKSRFLFDIVALSALISIFIFDLYRNIFLITFPIVILSLYDKESLLNKFLNKSIFKQSGDLSYAIYLNHALVINITNWFLRTFVSELTEKTIFNIAIYLIFLTCYSIATLFLVKKLEKYLNKTIK